MKRMCSYRFSDEFLAAIDHLGVLIVAREKSGFSWANKMTRTRAIQWAVRFTLKELTGAPKVEGSPFRSAKKKKAKRPVAMTSRPRSS